MEAKVRYTGYAGYGFLSPGKTGKGKRVISHKERLIERLEQRFKEHQASLRFITVGSLAMALSACKDDTLVQGSDTDDNFGNTPADEIFKGRLGDDVYGAVRGTLAGL